MVKVYEMVPGVIDRETAARYPSAGELTQRFVRHARCCIGRCVACGAEWRFGALRHEKVGYYPGEPVLRDVVRLNGYPTPAGPVVEIGNHWRDVCPMCASDVTELVSLHADLCDRAPR